MRIAALVALTVVASTVPGLAAPAPNSYASLKQPPSRPTECIPSPTLAQVTSKRDDNLASHGVHLYERDPSSYPPGWYRAVAVALTIVPATPSVTPSVTPSAN
ncbi:hypothetical protein EDB19DRAFT_1829370 [Suillus lakei]|nr:hypothetical protein EDB19DRAFT_1829370 [Suillus lakei]